MIIVVLCHREHDEKLKGKIISVSLKGSRSIRTRWLSLAKVETATFDLITSFYVINTNMIPKGIATLTHQ